MKSSVFLAALAFAAGAFAQEPASRPAAPSAEAKSPLRVLYVGDPAHPRTQEFVALLGASFAKVEAAPRPTLAADAAAGFDVVVVDGPRGAAPPEVAADWRRPTVLVGPTGGAVAAARKLKLTPFFRHVGGRAYDVRVAHPLFSAPVAAAVASAEVADASPAWRASPGGGGGLPIRAWRVHADGAGLPEGVAADAYGFEDSPDCEFFAGGFVPDRAGLAAIARQGPFLLWGFAAAPSAWTPAGRAAFADAIAYVARFDGAPILVTDPSPARDRALAWARRLDGADDGVPVARRFDEKLLAAAEGDAEKLVRLLDEGRAWLRADRRRVKLGDGAAATEVALDVFTFDDEIRNYGIRIDEPQLVDTMLNIMGHGEDVQKCHRLLVTYVGVDLGPDLRHWFSWWSRNKERAFFSDTAGFRFVVPEPAVTEELRRLSKFSRPAEK